MIAELVDWRLTIEIVDCGFGGSPQSTIVNLNLQSSISINNPQSQSSIRNRQNRQSSIRNRQ